MSDEVGGGILLIGWTTCFMALGWYFGSTYTIENTPARCEPTCYLSGYDDGTSDCTEILVDVVGDK